MEENRSASMRIHPNWLLKAVLPVAGVLLVGLAFFEAATISLERAERHLVLLVATAGAVAICGVLLVVLAVLFQRPLVELKQKIARLREGNLMVSVSFAGRADEIGELGRDFNEMVRQLRESREELQRLHRNQMSRAEHLATLGELAAGLAHEIRNPLGGIAGVIEIIGRDLPSGSTGREILQEVRQEVQHIQDILSDLLHYARPKPPQVHPADLNATAEQAVNLARQQVLSQPIQIEFTPASGLPMVEHDPAQILQVLLNLLLNAIQAVPGEGRVGLEVARGDRFAVIRVSDTGRGIAPENLPNLFRPFFTTKGQGTGLGLSLARRIVEDHGGRIEVQSQLGKGSEFRVWLPLRRAEGEAALSATSMVK